MRVAARTIVAIAAMVLAAGCGSSGAAPAPTSSGVSLASPRVQQIALAQSSNDLFSIFPAKPGSKSCSFPEGGLSSHTFHGTCATSIHPGATHEPTLVVSFRETWTLGPHCPPGDHCGPIRGFQHTWRVIEAEPMVTKGARLRIAATQQSGSTAPQDYR